jgi:hypothetical protein
MKDKSTINYTFIYVALTQFLFLIFKKMYIAFKLQPVSMHIVIYAVAVVLPTTEPFLRNKCIFYV